MCLFLVVSIFGSQYLEDFIEEEIDESCQTAEDYSLCVMDPPHDASNPDEVSPSTYFTLKHTQMFY